MKIEWDSEAWKDFQSILELNDKKTCKKILSLIEDIESNGIDKGIGKPERLKHELNNFFSREINKEDRLVYRIIDGDILQIIQCKTHYQKV